MRASRPRRDLSLLRTVRVDRTPAPLHGDHGVCVGRSSPLDPLSRHRVDNRAPHGVGHAGHDGGKGFRPVTTACEVRLGGKLWALLERCGQDRAYFLKEVEIHFVLPQGRARVMKSPGAGAVLRCCKLSAIFTVADAGSVGNSAPLLQRAVAAQSIRFCALH